jgi:hypothetical protein
MGHRFAITFFAGVLLAWLAVMAVLTRNAALAPESSGTMLVVFPVSVSEAEAITAIAASGGNVVKKSGLSFAWLVDAPEAGLAGRLKEHGALGAYRELPIPVELAGCLAVADAKIGEALH